MTIKRLRPSFTFTEERLAELRALMPEAFADGRVNWEALREALGEWTEAEGEGAEHFGLVWPGKREARRLASKPSRGTLVPLPGEGINEDKTRNLFIEGDNLEVLKLLQKSYAGRVKVIYIDPPYNTGSDLVYKDDFRDPLGEYLRKTGQLDEAGEVLTTNTRADGRFHSNWLTMMYPRLRLARTLLADDGVLFVSIDDKEVHNLRAILNEIFGEENFLGTVVRATGTTTGQDGAGFGSSFDYILVVGKSEQSQVGGLALSEKDVARFSQEDAKGRYSVLQLRKTGNADRRSDRPSMYYPVTAPDGTKVYPIGPTGYDSRWRCGQETLKKYIDEGLLTWKRVARDGEEQWAPYVKYYLEGREKRPSPLWTDIEGNKKATSEVKELLGDKVFTNPKPTAVIRRILDIATESDTGDLIMDFFAGSGTTGDAVWRANAADGGNRKFICVQLPEPVAQDSIAAQEGYEFVSSIALSRLKAAAKTHAKNKDLDLGFKVLQLRESNFKGWMDFDGDEIEQLEARFEDAETPLVNGWTRDALLTEVLLLQGFPLDADVKAQPVFTKNDVLLVTADQVGHRLWVCLDLKIHGDTLGKLTASEEDVFVCLDAALNDEAKLRLADRCTLETI